MRIFLTYGNDNPPQFALKVRLRISLTDENDNPPQFELKVRLRISPNYCKKSVKNVLFIIKKACLTTASFRNIMPTLTRVNLSFSQP